MKILVAVPVWQRRRHAGPRRRHAGLRRRHADLARPCWATSTSLGRHADLARPPRRRHADLAQLFTRSRRAASATWWPFFADLIKFQFLIGNASF